MKKALALLLATVMILSLCTVTAFAKDGPWEDPEQGMGSAVVYFSNYNEDTCAYVVKGSGEGLAIDNTAFPGASYDKATNTLTLKDVDAPGFSLSFWYMGDDFKIKVDGSCKLGTIYCTDQMGAYNTSLSIIGTGTLTINESKNYLRAINMYSLGSANPTKLSIAASVTLHMYAGEDCDDVVSILNTTIVSGDEAITADGKPVESVTTQRIYNTEYDYADIMVVNNSDEEYNPGLVAKSKSDPDGRYSVYFWDEKGPYSVTHFIWVDSLGYWAIDPTFGDWGNAISYSTRADFEKEYTIEQSSQPTKIRYTTDEREKNKGWEAVQLRKDGEPDEVYSGTAVWGSEGTSYENPEYYIIYHLIRDEEQGVYVKDTKFRSMSVKPDELESKGFSIVTENVVRDKTFRCWANSAPYDDDNWENDYEVVSCPTDPDGIYVVTGESYSVGDNGERLNEKIIVQKVQYDAENDVYFVTGKYSDNIYVPLGEIGVTYSYVEETATVNKMIRYIGDGYNFDNYSTEAVLMRKAGSDTPYCAEPYTEGDGTTMYNVHKLELRENGHYYAVKWNSYDSEIYGHDMSQQDLEEEGLTVVYSMQDTPFTIVGRVEFMTMMKYTDNKGNLYAADRWGDEVYSYAEDGLTGTYGETTYHYAVRSDKHAADLISTERRVETDSYSHFLKKTEYHHNGIGSYWVGDVNADGKVKNRDALILDRYIAGWKDAADQIKNWDAADMNRDGKVKNRDALMLDRYIAGWNDHQKYVIQVNG